MVSDAALLAWTTMPEKGMPRYTYAGCLLPSSSTLAIYTIIRPGMIPSLAESKDCDNMPRELQLRDELN